MLHELNEAQAPVSSLLIPGQLDRSERAVCPENTVKVNLIQLKVQVVQEKLLEVSLSWHQLGLLVRLGLHAIKSV